MRRSIAVVILAIVVITLIVVRMSLYVVDEINYALVLQIGKIQQVRTEPGLNFKIPLVNEVTYIDKRLLTSDTLPEEYLTSDQKRIVVDQVTRWRIKDPKAFFLAHSTEEAGRAKLERLVLGALRERIAERLYDVMISPERDAIMALARETVQTQVNNERWGIEIIDVRTKRADLPTAVEMTVYQRMASARKVEADRHRAQGQLRSDQITAQTNREVLIMIACADRVSKETRGQGEAAAIAIFAQGLQQDPDFFSFIRRLEAYGTSFNSQDRFVMSTDSNFFRLLSGESVPIPDTQATQGQIIPLSEDIVAPLTQKQIDILTEECTPETIEDIG